jgi:uncharacterized protein (UPF0264 family)
MTARRRHVSFLASVTDEREALLAAHAGADIIDCKDPSSGALGALPHSVVRAIRAAVPRHVPVSATIGDLACVPDRVGDAVAAMAATGVDYVKIGLFPGAEIAATIARLGTLSLKGCRLVGVMLADREPDLALVDDMRRAGFAGAMLDTAGKSGGTLLDCLSASELSEFIARTRGAGLFAGLAGSLRLDQIGGLMAFEPDVLGFRGALCLNRERASGIDAAAVQSIRRTIPRADCEPARDVSGLEELPA